MGPLSRKMHILIYSQALAKHSGGHIPQKHFIDPLVYMELRLAVVRFGYFWSEACCIGTEQKMALKKR